MIIEGISMRIAEGIKRQVPDHRSSVHVLKHAIAMILNVLFIVMFTLLISVFTGNAEEAVTCLIGFAVLRQFSGGFHLKSGAGCIAITTALFTLVSFMDMNVLYVLVVNFISLLLVIMFAPSRIERQSRIPKKHYHTLRVISCLIVMVNFWIQSPALTIAFFIQSVSLLHGKGGETHVIDQQS